jgi:hypothetical protein
LNRKPIAIVGGVIANKYLNGGAVWTRLNWILGMRRLGFEVYFLEQIAGDNCLDDQGRKVDFEVSSNLGYFRKVTRDFGLVGSAALILEDGKKIHGMTPGELHELARDADLIVNITGHVSLPEFMEAPACKVYIDLDPGFTQIWYRAGALGPNFQAHDHFFTIGEAIGSPGCSIPTGDVPWKPTRQPVVLEQWPVSVEGDPMRFTTVANWRDEYGTLEHDGRVLGLKVHEFRRLIGFPQRVAQSCEIALGIHDEDGADLERLRRNGWVIRNPRRVVPDPGAFREYVQRSGAEFSVAKGIYVGTRSGWFSDRTVRYLASGKPALVQDTGFSDAYPVGEGLLAFDTMQGAVAAAADISENYVHHCQAARRLAERYFDSDKVLGDLIEQLGIHG